MARLIDPRRRRRVVLVQQGTWAMKKESLPLAAGYLKAAVEVDPELSGEVEVRLVNLGGGASMGTMISEVFGGGTPDVIATSVFGWNFRQALTLSETFKQLNPGGLSILGGTHVANQADRVFRLAPEVDVIANGEGEETFPELLRAWFASPTTESFQQIGGISYRAPDGEKVTTPERARIPDLETIASPFLTGALPLVDAHGSFRYDVAILETNRGCPYKCSFCYWGGAIGQRVRRFSRERLAAEVEMFARLEVETLVLCDANFGMQQADEEFLDDIIEIRSRYGYPRAIEASWAKNKSATFYRMVDRMHRVGLHSSFTLALQTLDDPTLVAMRRRNMRVNDWRDLSDWLKEKGLDCYAELLWGAPGETAKTFLEGYDLLAPHVSRIATYPLMILPNTDYAEERERHGFITARGEADDFEYVLANASITLEDNAAMQGFLLWARIAAENSFFRHIWSPMRLLGRLTQSEVLRSLATWFEERPEEGADALRAPKAILEPALVNRAVRALFLDPEVHDLLRRWWQESIGPRLDPEYREVLAEVFRFELMTLPVVDPDQHPARPMRDGLVDPPLYRSTIPFAFDVPDLVRQLETTGEATARPSGPVTYLMSWRPGFVDYIDNHELALRFMAETTLRNEVSHG